jgi:hypothetical protein
MPENDGPTAIQLLFKPRPEQEKLPPMKKILPKCATFRLNSRNYFCNSDHTTQTMKRIALPILLAGTLLAQVAHAQSSSTPVIGYYKFDVPTGKSIWTCAFVAKKDFQGAATTVVGGANTIITQSGAGWSLNQFQTSANPASQSSHYVEILSGAFAGTVADIISNDGSSITVEGDFGSSSFTYCVRVHATVASVFKSAGLGAFEDEILIFNDQGVARSYQYDDTPGSEQIVDAVDQSTNRDNDIVYPGSAFVLTIGTPKTLTFGGNQISYVKTGQTKIPLYAGKPNLVGLFDPIVASAPLTTVAGNEGHTISTIGLIESGLSPFEDEIAVFGISGGSYTRTGLYYFDDTNIPGDIVDSITNANVGTTVIANGTGFMVTPTGNRVYTQPSYYTP